MKRGEVGIRFCVTGALVAIVLVSAGCSTSIGYPREHAIFDDSPICLWHGERTRTMAFSRSFFTSFGDPVISWVCPEHHVVSAKPAAGKVRRHLSGLGYKDETERRPLADFDWFRTRYVHEDSKYFESRFPRSAEMLDHAAIIVGVRPTVFVVVHRPAQWGPRHRGASEVDQARGGVIIHLPDGVLDGTRLPIFGGDDEHLARMRVGVVGVDGLVEIDARRAGEVVVGDVLVRWVMREETQAQAPWDRADDPEAPSARWVEFLASKSE